MKKKDDYIQVIQSAEEVLSKRETVGIEYELKKLQECRHSIEDKQLKFELNRLTYRMLEFLKRETEALAVLESMLEDSSDIRPKSLILREMGLTYMRMNQRERGLDCLKNYYKEAETNEIYDVMTDAALWLARFFYSGKDYKQAMEYSNQAIFLSKKERNPFASAEAQMINGLVLYREGQTNLALDILREAEEMAIDANIQALVLRIAIARCKIFVDQQNWEAVSLTINNLYDTIDPLSI